MAGKNENRPRDSEVPVEEWLQQIGATKICFTGGSPDKGAPDFVTAYGGKKVAVQVTLLHDTKGWGKTREHAILREARRLYDEAYKEGFAWHGRIEYDPLETRNSMKDVSWKKRMYDALRSNYGGEFQLLSPEKRRGRGVVVILHAASNRGSMSQVDTDDGLGILNALHERVITVLKEKTDSANENMKSGRFDQWWLVFDDDILISPKGILGSSQIHFIEERVRNRHERQRWSKIVLMSRFQTVPPPERSPKWYWPLWEDESYEPLPHSP